MEIATAGHPLTFGSASKLGDIAPTDDVVWQRLRAAGAILIGKTTTPEFFHKVTTDSPLYGITRNPWSLAIAPAVRAAARQRRWPPALAPSRSARMVAARCVSLPRRRPRLRSNQPWDASPWPLSRYFRQLRLSRPDGAQCPGSLDNAGGHVGAGRLGCGKPWSSKGDAAPRGFASPRIGVLNPSGVDPAVAKLVDASLGRLAEAGAALSPLDGDFLEGAYDIYRVVAAVGHAARVRTVSAAAQATWSQSFRELVSHGLSYSADQYEAAQQARTRLFRAVQAVFDDFDVIATPVLTTPPLLVDAESSVGSPEYAAMAVALYPFNLTGHPAISIPCGFTSGGLPVGLQLVGPWFGEAELLRLAGLLESETLWIERRPSL